MRAALSVYDHLFHKQGRLLAVSACRVSFDRDEHFDVAGRRCWSSLAQSAVCGTSTAAKSSSVRYELCSFALALLKSRVFSHPRDKLEGHPDVVL